MSASASAPPEPSPSVHFEEGDEKSKKDQKGGKKRSIRTRRWDGEKPKGGKRERAGSRNAEAAAAAVSGEVAPDNDGEDKGPRLPKRQCAILLGFCGSGYNGMQIQTTPDVRTIENTLFDALVRAGAVSKDNSDNPTKINLGRAARTDAGVHAAGNVVSAKVITSIPDKPDFVAAVNAELPPEIRIWGCVRVQNSFSARTLCDSRKYTYYFPSYLLIPPKPNSGLHGTTALADSPAHPFWEGCPVDSTPADDLARKRAWRASTEDMQRLRAAATRFEGTHNFHNFTVARDFNDRACQRFMKSIEVGDPTVYGDRDTEWIAVMLHGSSFMLHQRKMIAALVLAVRTNTPTQLIDELYGPRRVFVPKMPSLGLLLESPVFESYNKRMTTVSANFTPDDPNYRAPIDFDIHKDEIEAFKQAHIYERMRDIEQRGGLFDAWVRSIDKYSGNDLAYLNARGVIPDRAALPPKGQARQNPFREKRKFDLTDYSAAQLSEVMRETEADDGTEGQDEEAEAAGLSKKELADMEG
ncbi:pseudouridine synthase [Peniophora sp. CONT]|nr:pseudouridine synthase [Peniophora sp. CONT]